MEYATRWQQHTQSHSDTIVELEKLYCCVHITDITEKGKSILGLCRSPSPPGPYTQSHRAYTRLTQ